MEDCAVVPEVISVSLQLHLADVTHQPMHPFRIRAQPLSCDFNCGWRDVQYRQIFVSTMKKVVDQGRFPATYINDGDGSRLGSSLDECQRGFKVSTVPANRVGSLCRVDLFPMCLCIHESTLRPLFYNSLLQ